MMLRRLAAPAILATLAALPLAAPAAADRPATASQKRAIANALRTPRTCVTVRLSSPSRRYAGVYVRRHTGSCSDVGDGFVIVRRSSSGRWRQAYAGSDCMAPSRKIVPRSVWRDLSPRFCD